MAAGCGLLLLPWMPVTARRRAQTTEWLLLSATIAQLVCLHIGWMYLYLCASTPLAIRTSSDRHAVMFGVAPEAVTSPTPTPTAADVQAEYGRSIADVLGRELKRYIVLTALVTLLIAVTELAHWRLTKPGHLRSLVLGLLACLFLLQGYCLHGQNQLVERHREIVNAILSSTSTRQSGEGAGASAIAPAVSMPTLRLLLLGQGTLAGLICAVWIGASRRESDVSP